MEEIFVVILRVIGGFLKWLFIIAIVDFLLYGFGYLICKTFTLGKFPIAKKNNQTLCIAVGLIFLAIAIVLIAFFNRQ